MTTFNGPLRLNRLNPHYFTDASGEAIYLTGSHTWANLVEMKLSVGPDFDYAKWLDFMASHHHNFMRLWTWHHTEYAPWTEEHVLFDPTPHHRTGPGLAIDGKPLFDLGKWNQAYFDRLRERVIMADQKGIYVSVMLFEGWCLKWAAPGCDPWPYHPFNFHNNVNGVNGDPNNDGKADIFSLEVPEVVDFQKTYIRKVIDTVNDLDNVLFEIINEIPNDERGVKWHYHMIDYVHSYESEKPKQHPVGMTAEGGTQYNPILFDSPADWISPGRGPLEEYMYNPPPADGSKVILLDTDHLWGYGGNYIWAWKSFTRGLNPLFMDPWNPLPGKTRPGGPPSNDINRPDFPDWEPLRLNLGNIRRLAQSVDMNRMVPHSELVSSSYCLADPGQTYFVYQPVDAQVQVNLLGCKGTFTVEFYYPRTGKAVSASPVIADNWHHFVSPEGMDFVLILRKQI